MMDGLLDGMYDTMLAVVRAGTNRHPVWGTHYQVAYSDGDFNDAPPYSLSKLATRLSEATVECTAEAMRQMRK
jgi:hypothetical protein